MKSVSGLGKYFLAILLLILASWECQAELKVESKNHVQNQSPGRCTWCAVETLSLSHGYEQCRGLAESNPRSAYLYEAAESLDRLKIPNKSYRLNKSWHYNVMYRKEKKYGEFLAAVCYSQDQANKYVEANKHIKGDWRIHKQWQCDVRELFQAVEDDIGAAVTVEQGRTDEHRLHMLVVTDVKDGLAHLVDSNYRRGEVVRMPLLEFLRQWTGEMMIIRPRKN